jgi:hypothetical protein
MATKYDGSRKRGCGRPLTKAELAKLVLEMDHLLSSMPLDLCRIEFWDSTGAAPLRAS